jgi:hypothetical protein
MPCSILPPRFTPEALPGAGGCILPVGHSGPHRDIVEGVAWLWEDDFTCDCCAGDDSDRCFVFWQAPSSPSA